jgi:protein-disulfide isomerase
MMRRWEIVLVALLGIVGGAVGSAYYYRQAPIMTDKSAVRAVVAEMAAAGDLKLPPAPIQTDSTAVRAIVGQMISDYDVKTKLNSPKIASLDPADLDPMIEKYLMSDPKVLQRLSDALAQQNQADEALKTKQALAANSDAIFNDADQVVIGNPKGDVTLVEMFDYNCGYCRGALPDLATLLNEDKNLRVVLKEFPILSAESVDAARVAVQVAKSGVDYWAFHQALFTGRGQVDATMALNEAKTLGLDPDTLKAGMQAKPVSDALQKSYDLAKVLNVSGTPTYIIGDKIIPGAVPIDDLRTAIANMRACGSAVSCQKPT